ncbi:hypothetical protein C8039_15925 [Halogeometricum sp. wsp3]|nr:hypothetical protein C8039_15925 [Halogeometricum sp. wsp3]
MGYHTVDEPLGVRDDGIVFIDDEYPVDHCLLLCFENRPLSGDFHLVFPLFSHFAGDTDQPSTVPSITSGVSRYSSTSYRFPRNSTLTPHGVRRVHRRLGPDTGLPRTRSESSAGGNSKPTQSSLVVS